MPKDEETVELADVHVKTKLPKLTKSKKDMWVFETNKGTLMCFDPSTAAKVNPSDTMGYTLTAVPPGDGFKSYILKGVVKVAEHVDASPAARPAAAQVPAQYSETATGKSYTPTGMSGDLMKDTRISKLSVFAAIAQIQAAKIKVNPDLAAASTAAIVCETMDLTNAVIAELIYPERQPMVPAAAPAAANGPVSEEPPFKAPAQPAAQPAGQPAATTAMPPVTPKPDAAPVQQNYTPPPAVQVATPPVTPAVPPVMMQSAPDKAAQAKALFGVKPSLEADMAARVARMLKKA
jgi:hypothetical protein